MPVLTVTVNVEETPWEDLKDLADQGKVDLVMGNEATTIRVGGLPRGMQTGKTSVSIAIPMKNGRVLLTETSLALFLMAADILRAKYPNG